MYYLGLVLFLLCDFICYAIADEKKRQESFLYKLPFGGIIALIKFGRN